MKKILLLFALLLAVSMSALAQEFVDSNGIKYNVTSVENKTVEVISKAFAGYSGNIVIPATVTNEGVTYNVTGIGGEAFDRCDLTSVTLPNCVTDIGDNAFNQCSNLTSITIPGTVINIGERAFAYCKKLTSITIPSSVKSIGKYAFNNCSSLASISVDEGNTAYDSRGNCNAIIETETNTLIFGCNNTVIPSSVTAIGDYALYYCEKITSITLPDGLKSIGKHAFGYCKDLASVIIPSSVETLDSYAFSSCENLATVALSNGIKSIGHYAFGFCEKLTSVTIPGSVTEIGNVAFSNCVRLESITVLGSTPPTLGGESVFGSVDRSIPVYVPNPAAYSNVSWGGFTNFIAIELDQFNQDAIDEINAAKSGVSLTEDEVTAINGCIATIEGVTTLTDDNLATIENAKNAALTIISQAIIRTTRESALAAIEAAMQGETSDYLTGLVQQYIDIINSATDMTIINNTKNTALVALSSAVAAYKACKSETLGSLGTKQAGPALIVADKDGNEVILYSPESVEYIKVNDK